MTACSSLHAFPSLQLHHCPPCLQPSFLTLSSRNLLYCNKTTFVSPSFASYKLSKRDFKALKSQLGEESAVLETSSSSEVESGTDEIDLSGITDLELDFCSRPILDERGKRVWELLICDRTRKFEYAEYFSSNKINSANLKDALARIIERFGLQRPQKIRFFRAQMQAIITKACSELDIRAVPSQRCIALMQLLAERFESVYSKDPKFQSGPSNLLQVESTVVQNLPDSLRGEEWAFVQLPLSGVLEELSRVESKSMFGATLDLKSMGIIAEGTESTIMVPGVAVSSSRALPLAAWTSALELASLSVDLQRACIVLSSGLTDRWRYAFYRKAAGATEEAKAWEEAKKKCHGLHFLAIQSSLDSEDCNGFWLMRDLPEPLL